MYKAGDVARLIVKTTNQGDFGEKAQLQIYVPKLNVYSFVNNANIGVSQNNLLEAEFAIPKTAKKGLYLAKFTLKTANGGFKTSYWQFRVE